MADILLDVLDEHEETYLQQFYENKKMREAVKKVLLMFLYNNGVPKKSKAHDPTVNYAFTCVANDLKISDEDAGKHLKILWEAICLIETAFSNMARFQKGEESKGRGGNQAR